jgi:PAP2 superfamily
MSLSAVSQSTPDARVPLWHDFLASLRENSPLVLFTILFGLAPIIVARKFSVPTLPYGQLWLAYLGFIATAGIAVFAAFALWYLYHARVRKVPNFQAEAWRRIRNDFLHRDRLFLALPVLALWPITASAFSYLKSAIELIQPFHLDPLLYQWDRVLHFGIDPWRILQPIVGYTWITYLINFVYALWFFVLQAVLMLQSGATGDRKRRMQFLLTFALTWALIGSLAATLMSSAGPCYYGLVVGGPDPYAPLMSYLHGVAANLSLGAFGHELHIPFSALILQDLLWQSQLTGDFGIAKGISAAPSMHIASTWIIARVAWSMGRTARFFGSLFLLFIFVGSIHLGWHYALDGYLAIAGAWALWRLTGWLLDRRAVQAWLWPDRIDASSKVAS